MLRGTCDCDELQGNVERIVALEVLPWPDGKAIENMHPSHAV